MKKNFLLFTICPLLSFADTSINTLFSQEVSLTDELNMTIQFKESDGGVLIPQHTHPYLGTVYLISGQVEVDIEGEKTLYKAGDSWLEPKNKIHSGKSIGPIKYFVVYHHQPGQPYTN
ncbi:MAG: cupin domain-containing protein [SAR86 cluster bacterium]|nr:cupin domain-containing protein [SAR86 cluster bacterium]